MPPPPPRPAANSLMPYNYLTVSAGSVLGHLASPDPHAIHLALLKLSFLAAVLALPLIFRNRILEALKPKSAQYTELAEADR